MKAHKVVITGGPGTGKSSIVSYLKEKGYTCFEEISRNITLTARREGIEQLFLRKPLLFSKKLLEGRIQQYQDAHGIKECPVFLDRGIPDIVAYLDYIGATYPIGFIEACKAYKYDTAFILAPWQDIFIGDSERYENFDQAKRIHQHLLKTYFRFGYDLIDVPFQPIAERGEFVLQHLNSN